MTPSPAPRRRGRPPRLGREQVLAAAVELADRDGLAALTMRSVAHRLGAEAMSLYRHVANKQDLLDGMVDMVYAEIDVPEPGGDWKAEMRARAVSARTALVSHPWAIALMESRETPGPANLRHHEAVLAILVGAGFTGAAATRIYNLFDSYIYGFAIQEQALPVATPEQLAEYGTAILDRLPAAEYPLLSQVSRELIEAGFDYRAEFEAGLDLILDALGPASPRRRRRQPSRRIGPA
jgi:AcrR family transcriptional regulator